MIATCRNLNAIAVWVVDEQELLTVVSCSDTFNDFYVGFDQSFGSRFQIGDFESDLVTQPPVEGR